MCNVFYTYCALELAHLHDYLLSPLISLFGFLNFSFWYLRTMYAAMLAFLVLDSQRRARGIIFYMYK